MTPTLQNNIVVSKQLHVQFSTCPTHVDCNHSLTADLPEDLIVACISCMEATLSD